MKDGLTRRQVMNAGVAMGLGTLSARLGYAESVVPQPTNEPRKVSTKPETEFSHYSRFRPSFGGPPRLRTVFRQAGPRVASVRARAGHGRHPGPGESSLEDGQWRQRV